MISLHVYRERRAGVGPSRLDQQPEQRADRTRHYCPGRPALVIAELPARPTPRHPRQIIELVGRDLVERVQIDAVPPARSAVVGCLEEDVDVRTPAPPFELSKELVRLRSAASNLLRRPVDRCRLQDIPNRDVRQDRRGDGIVPNEERGSLPYFSGPEALLSGVSEIMVSVSAVAT